MRLLGSADDSTPRDEAGNDEAPCAVLVLTRDSLGESGRIGQDNVPWFGGNQLATNGSSKDSLESPTSRREYLRVTEANTRSIDNEVDVLNKPRYLIYVSETCLHRLAASDDEPSQ